MAQRDPAYRRYIARFIPLAIFYLASVMLATWLLPDDAPINALLIGLGLMTGLAVAGWIWTFARLLIELEDEFLKLLEVRKMIVATGFILLITSMWGILELYSPAIPKLPVFFVFPLWCLGLALGQLYNRITMGTGGGPC
ncbi:MAG: hypothetical protein ABJP34_03900 [Erythrobacter sp.]